ncbi:MAG: hypothetical protein ISS48_01620 [Candidatus Aenigmarchaeota archaeon]|nr:hypothetical protein [Candidatus Aenigmarchaeota archaeon]
MPKIKVKKRAGGFEYFNIEKVKKSLLNAGCNLNESDAIASEIKKWAENQPGKIVHSLEIERQVIEHTKERHKDILISFLIYAKNKIKPIKQVFNKKDISQVLASLFVILQIYALDVIFVPFDRGVPIFFTSLFTCGLILRLNVEKKEMWKHLITGVISVALLSVLTGSILGVRPEEMLLAISVGMPVAAAIDTL